jgi:hypothetical protein
VFPGVTTTLPGAPGTPIGVTDTADEAGLVPAAFVALTVQEYGVPVVSPETTIGLAVPMPVTPTPFAEHVAV